MATIHVNIGVAGANGSASDAPIRKTTTQSCPAYTSSATAGYVQYNGADLVLNAGDLVEISTSGNIVANFTKVATTTDGHRISTNNTSRPEPFLCDKDGQKISIVDQ